jgi:hypothetical protein
LFADGQVSCSILDTLAIEQNWICTKSISLDHVVLLELTMRCLVISPGYGQRFEAFYYSFDKRIINGLIRNDCHVVHLSDRDLADSVIGIRALGKKYANYKIANVAKNFRPNFVLLFHADIVTNATLKEIKSTCDCKIANIDCDSICNKGKFERLTKRHPYVDCTFITTAGERLEQLRATGMHVWFIPNPADATIDIEADLAVKKEYDLVYAAGAPLDSERWQLMNTIEEKAPDLKIGKFGSVIKVIGHEYYDLLNNTRFGLNWSVENNIKYYSSDRIAQLFGAGVAVCTHRATGYGDFLSDGEIVLFDDEYELIEKIRYLKANDRWTDVARAGRKKYLQLFSEKEVCRYLLSVLRNQNLSQFDYLAACSVSSVSPIS